MRRYLIFIAFTGLILFPFCSNAQEFAMLPTTEQEQVQSLTIAYNMLKATVGIGNKFADFKGDFEKKDAAGNSYYKVNGLDLGASSQYVLVNAKGATMYVAFFESKDVNNKSAILAFNAFAGGIMTIRQNTDIAVTIDDAETKGGIIKYYLRARGTKGASLIFAPVDNTAALLVGIQ